MKYTVVSALLIAATLHAQDAGPLIRAESRTVLVDAVATTKGKFAQDLTAKDFQIWEDGREQKITGFSLENASVSAQRPGKHYIVFVFDTSGFPRNAELAAHQQALLFLQGFAAPDRYMAVVGHDYSGTHVLQNFTTDREKLKNALSMMPARTSMLNPSQDTPSYRAMLEGMNTLAASLANVRGRKAMIFFTVSMPPDPDLEADVNATIAAFNKANVAVYTVAPNVQSPVDSSCNGVCAPGIGSRRPYPDAPFNAPTLLSGPTSVLPPFSENTGGLAFIMNDNLAGSLGRVAQEQDWYYLLTYTPSVESPEGSCHTLRVKSDRGDVDVRARKAYCTTTPSALSGIKSQESNVQAHDGAPAMAAEMRLPWFYTAPEIAGVHLAMDIDPASIKFKNEKGRFHAELSFAGAASLPDNSVAARVNDTVKLDFDNQQQVDAFHKVPYHYENQFAIAPGKYRFTMAFSSDSGAFGKLESPLEIDAWDGKSLGFSAPALSNTARRAQDLTDSLDPSLLEGAHPLVANNTEVIPAGDAVFHPGGTAIVYFEAYEPLLVSAKPDALPQVGVRIRVLDRNGKEKANTGVQVLAHFMHPGNPIIPIVTPVPIAGLTSGKYTLELAALRPGGQPLIRTADFEIR